MSLGNKQIEKAIVGPSRTLTAARSLTSWFAAECARLAKERKLFLLELARRPGDEALFAALKQNRQERRDLSLGWENSSLRKRIKRAERAVVDDSRSGSPEKRSVLSASPAAPARAAGTASSRKTAKSIVGYAAKFNVLSQDLGGFREKIEPGAFKEALAKSDVRFLFNHDSNFIFGRTSSFTLELKEDSIGLNFVCYLIPFDPASYSLARRIDRGDISGCSYCFIVARDRWELATKPGDIDIRVIDRFEEIFDVGPVCYPAFLQTSVSAVFEELPARSRPPADVTSDTEYDFDLDADIEEEYAFYLDRDRQRRRQIEKNYKKAGEILLRNREWLKANVK